MSALSSASRPAGAGAERSATGLPRWWPLAALTLLAAVLRLSTLDLQSFWYDEAFTPVHVLHVSLFSTLRAVAHTENSPPLWYVIAWADARVLGTGEVALRLPSALAGIAVVPLAWAIGAELAGRRAAIACAALMAVNPLFVWYSQEARAYGLFALTATLLLLCFLRAEREPTRGRLAAFALAGALALLSHYFAVFLLIPMALWLLRPTAAARRAGTLWPAAAAVAAVAAVGLALLPLISSQGGHGTQWIGRWPLGERLQAIPQYYLTGPSGAPLGHGVELLLALPILAAVGLGLWRLTEPLPAATTPSSVTASRRSELHKAVVLASVAACGALIPLAMVAFGADYLAPRNLIGAMVPLSALIALLGATPAAGRAGALLLALAAVGLLAVSIDVNLSPRLQRGNWRDLAHEIGPGSPARAVTTVELGSAPLEYYIPGLRPLAPRSTVLLREIEETGYSPLRRSAGIPPAAGFRLVSRREVDGLIVYRFVSPVPRAVSEAALRRHVITLEHPEVLVSRGAVVRSAGR